MEDRLLELKIGDFLEPKIILSLLSEYKNFPLEEKPKIDKIIKEKFSNVLKDIGLINSVEGLEFFERLCVLFIIIYFFKDKGLNEKRIHMTIEPHFSIFDEATAKFLIEKGALVVFTPNIYRYIYMDYKEKEIKEENTGSSLIKVIFLDYDINIETEIGKLDCKKLCETYMTEMLLISPNQILYIPLYLEQSYYALRISRNYIKKNPLAYQYVVEHALNYYYKISEEGVIEKKKVKKLYQKRYERFFEFLSLLEGETSSEELKKVLKKYAYRIFSSFLSIHSEIYSDMETEEEEKEKISELMLKFDYLFKKKISKSEEITSTVTEEFKQGEHLISTIKEIYYEEIKEKFAMTEEWVEKNVTIVYFINIDRNLLLRILSDLEVYDKNGNKTVNHSFLLITEFEIYYINIEENKEKVEKYEHFLKKLDENLIETMPPIKYYVKNLLNSEEKWEYKEDKIEVKELIASILERRMLGEGSRNLLMLDFYKKKNISS